MPPLGYRKLDKAREDIIEAYKIIRDNNSRLRIIYSNEELKDLPSKSYIKVNRIVLNHQEKVKKFNEFTVNDAIALYNSKDKQAIYLNHICNPSRHFKNIHHLF